MRNCAEFPSGMLIIFHWTFEYNNDEACLHTIFSGFMKLENVLRYGNWHKDVPNATTVYILLFVLLATQATKQKY